MTQNSILVWPLDSDLAESKAVAYRNLFADALAEKSPEDIIKSYVYAQVPDLRQTFRAASSLLPVPLAGRGIELGAGCGVFSSLAAESERVREVLALEVCEGMVRKVIPKVSQHVLGDLAYKVVPVVGSFDDLRVDDASLDFAIEWDSLHHSDNLVKTLQECYRVLKPGAVALFFDRAHPDSTPDSVIEGLLAKTYSKEFLRDNYYPEDVVLTRRENGEHEFRLREWKDAFAQARFQLLRVGVISKRVRLKEAIVGLLSLLPRRLSRYLYRSEGPRFKTFLDWVIQEVGVRFNSKLSVARLAGAKKSTVFILKKPS